MLFFGLSARLFCLSARSLFFCLSARSLFFCLSAAPFFGAFLPVQWKYLCLHDSLATAGGRRRSGIWSIAGVASVVG